MLTFQSRIFAVFIAATVLAPSVVPYVQAAELVMFERKNCPWCVVWNRDIGPIYAKSPEGKRAPLRRVDTRAPRPADLAHIEVRYTPTFVLMDKGKEIGRIDNYTSSLFFWPQLDALLAKLPAK